MTKSPFRSFVVRVVVLLPPFFYAWYQLLPWFVPGLAELLDPVLRSFWPDMLAAVNGADGKIVVVSRMVSGADAMGAGLKGVVLNPYTYSYGLPLFFALAIASTAPGWRHVGRILTGLLILVAGLCFSVFASLLFMFQFDEGFQRLGAFAAQSDNDALVEYIHFVGFRVTPRALPVLLWAVLYRDWVAEMIRPLRQGKPDAAGASSVE